MTIKQLGISILLGIIACGSCGRAQNGFTEEELSLIHEADSIMRVLTVCDPADLAVLRAPSIDLSAQALMSDEYAALCSLMVATVTHPSQDGVGIAGPQVGLNRRVVAVQRFDKEPDYPFEVYPNIRIIWASDSLAYGPEGCLSVPGRSGDVLRSQEIVIEYACPDLCGKADEFLRNGDIRTARHGDRTGSDDGRDSGDRTGSDDGRDSGDRTGSGGIPVIRDTVKGYTAVIFQHEIDHLDGVLYIDRL